MPQSKVWPRVPQALLAPLPKVPAFAIHFKKNSLQIYNALHVCICM